MPVVAPLKSSTKLLVHSTATNVFSYRRLIGKLSFLQHTQPDIAFKIQYLSQFLQCPQVPHMFTAFHVLRYLMNDSS